jgi:hypothetical protein
MGISNPLGGGGNFEAYVPKITNQVVNNSTVMVNDNELVVALPTGSRIYRVQLDLIIANAAAVAGFKFQFTGPAGATWNGNCFMNSGSATTFTQISTISDVALPEVMAGGFTAGFGTGKLQFIGFVKLAAAVGNLQLQWAQNAADPTNTTMYKGSILSVSLV